MDWGNRQGQVIEDHVGYVKTLRFHADTVGLLQLDLHFGKSTLEVRGGLTGVGEMDAACLRGCPTFHGRDDMGLNFDSVSERRGKSE